MQFVKIPKSSIGYLAVFVAAITSFFVWYAGYSISAHAGASLPIMFYLMIVGMSLLYFGTVGSVIALLLFGGVLFMYFSGMAISDTDKPHYIFCLSALIYGVALQGAGLLFILSFFAKESAIDP